MPLKLYPAIAADAGRISEIHMAAFASNAMLLAQFPTPEVREGLRESIRLKALADIEDPKITVLVVLDIPQQSDTSGMGGTQKGGFCHPDMNKMSSKSHNEEFQTRNVIAFAKWSHPVSKDEEYEETAWIWPPGTNLNILGSWAAAAEEVQNRLVGDRPCYRLTFMGTDPSHERRGAASMMVCWGVEQCRTDNVLGYLESTLDSAPFYKKTGFVESGRITLKYQVKNQDRYDIYEELAFVHHPSTI